MLGANDGIVSTASLMVGVAAATATQGSIMITRVAGLVAGAISMAAGEYVSVHSQADTAAADLARETAELQKDPEAEHRELAAIYVSRGLDVDLAKDVATQLMQHDAIGTHARDELGISETLSAQPIQAALASAASFAGAGAGDCNETSRLADCVDRGDIARIFGSARCARGQSGRCQSVGQRMARHVLGSPCAGHHRRRRQIDWCGGLTCPQSLLVPQCLNRIHPRSTSSREVSEQHADARREQQ